MEPSIRDRLEAFRDTLRVLKPAILASGTVWYLLGALSFLPYLVWVAAFHFGISPFGSGLLFFASQFVFPFRWIVPYPQNVGVHLGVWISAGFLYGGVIHRLQIRRYAIILAGAAATIAATTLVLHMILGLLGYRFQLDGP